MITNEQVQANIKNVNERVKANIDRVNKRVQDNINKTNERVNRQIELADYIAKRNYETFKLTVAGVERDLIKFPVDEKVDIAAFIMFGDVEVTEKAASELLKICPEHDVVVSAEAKGIPLCYEMARQGCREYVIARKSVKVYMRNCAKVTVKSITTAKEQTLYLGEDDVDFLKGKRVLIVDDVISTGESLKALEELMEVCEANVVGKAAVLAEGAAKDRDDIIYLEPLPVFVKE